MRTQVSAESGFSLMELMVAMTIMLLISGAAISALLKMTTAQATIWSRTQMHSGVRGATEVLQQEVGQAGRISLGTTAVTITAASTVGSAAGATKDLTVSSNTGMFVGQILTIDAGASQENVTVTVVPTSPTTSVTVRPLPLTNTILAHAANAPVRVFGGFSAGIVPPAVTNGSDGTHLKLFGDINGDGNMVYIEYTCAVPSGGVGYLYRNSMPWNQTTASAAPTQSQILLSNVVENPGGTACFTYDAKTVSGTTYVIDVAITLTVQTQRVDPVTKQFQKETKALLNVSPRNVFNAWQIASLGISERIQPTPPTITTLLQ
jgi:prepilin-type N-terminal cleavage/methylation domain-containing protein